jgi:hypothetical protein
MTPLLIGFLKHYPRGGLHGGAREREREREREEREREREREREAR